jgi:hypothetical protein
MMYVLHTVQACEARGCSLLSWLLVRTTYQELYCKYIALSMLTNTENMHDFILAADVGNALTATCYIMKQ